MKPTISVLRHFLPENKGCGMLETPTRYGHYQLFLLLENAAFGIVDTRPARPAGRDRSYPPRRAHASGPWLVFPPKFARGRESPDLPSLPTSHMGTIMGSVAKIESLEGVAGRY